MRRAGFTLIELVLVLAILAMMVALVAPALARSSRARTLEQDALRLVSLTEYARDEAVSLGVSMAVYVDSATQQYGLEPASTSSGVDLRKDFTLNSDLHFEPVTGDAKKQGRVITFTPEGVLDISAVSAITITDRNGNSRQVMRQSDGWGYELAKEGAR